MRAGCEGKISRHHLEDTVQYVGLYRMVVNLDGKYEGWNFNSGNYLFTTDTK